MTTSHVGSAFGILASAAAMVAVLAGTMDRASADQTGAGRAFGPGRCGPIDPSYVRVANATGGQALPLGPTEVGAAASLMAASFNAETVFWATAPLASSGQTITVPVDGVTSRVAFVLSTDGSIADMTVTDPGGTLVTAGTGVDAFGFGCVRGFAVERPVAGEWTVRAGGAGTYWFVVHARSDLGLDDAAFVQVAGRPAHEGLFRDSGTADRRSPGHPACTHHARGRHRRDLRPRLHERRALAGHRTLAGHGEPYGRGVCWRDRQPAERSLPRACQRARPNRCRLSARLASSVSRRDGGSRSAADGHPPARATNAGNRERQNRRSARAIADRRRAECDVLRVEPATLQLSANESRDVTVWADVPADGTPLSPEIVVTAESPTDPAAANSAIIRATLDPVR